MGQLKFSMYFELQLGLLLKISDVVIEIHLPFIAIYIATSKHAKGIEIFNRYFK
jgi:hypothetical protein